MVGFIGALIGGAAKGWGAGQMEAIKAKREEQLANLDRQFRADEGNLNRAVQREQIASQEKLTTAQLGVQERLGKLQSDTAITTQGMQGETATTVAEIGATSDAARNETAEKIAKWQIEAQNTPTLVQTQTGWAWQKKDGTMMAAPIDPSTGKPLDPLVGKDDTDQIANYKFLSAIPGMDPEDAKRMAFEKTDWVGTRERLIKANLEAITTDWTKATEDDITLATQRADEMMEGMQTTGKPGSAGGSSTGTPDVSGSTPATTTPDGTRRSTAVTDSETTTTLAPAQKKIAIAKAQEYIRAGKSRTEVTKWLKKYNITPSEAGL